MSRNATAEMQAQRALERSQATLDRLVRLSPDAICVASMRDGRILLANPAFLQLAGRPEEEVVGHNGFELGLWRDEESMFALGRAIRAQGGVRDFRTVAWRPDGEARSVLITAASFAPLIVMSTCCVVPSAVDTENTSCSVWPTFSACTAALPVSYTHLRAHET